MNIFKGKRKYALLAAAVTASILGGYSAAAVESPVTEFHTTLTGDRSADTEYKGNIDGKGKYFFTNTEEGKGSYVKPEVPSVKEYTNTLTGADYIDTAYADAIKDGVYTFTQDTQITHKQYGIELMEDTKINAEGKTLTLNVKDVTGVPGTGIKIDDANTLSIKADTVKMNLTGTKVGSDGLQGVRITNGNAKLTVDGNMDITAKGDNNTIGIYNRGNVVVNGDVKLDIDGNNGGYQYYGATGLYATSSMKDSKGGSITVNGNVDFQGNANGIWANAGGAVVNVKGGSIVVKEGQTMGYAAIKAENGTVNMNVVRDSEGNVTGAGTNDVTIKGNLSLDTGAVNSADVHGTKSEINLGLSTAESSLTGVVQNSFAEGGKKAGDKTFTGDANLWLQNGATWNNEVVDTIIKNPWGGEKWAGSRVTNFTGGESEAKAGNIFQKDNNSLTISNYSGYTNIFYAHEGNGEAAENYKAGDTIIRKAAEGSVVSLITDNTGVSMNNEASVANVLNALAGKLTYSNFVTGEKNLTGFVKIADGLTASSAALKTGDITFTEEGKGSYVSQAPVVPSKTEFTTVLTGDAATDTEYAGNIKDGKYVFTANTTITAAGQTAVEVKAPLTIDAGNNQLVLMAKNGDFNKAVPLFKQAVEGTTSIKADKLVIKNGTNDFNERSGMEVTNGNVDINADVDMKLSSMSNAYGIYVKANGSSVAIHGDLNLADSEQFDSINGLHVENTADWGAKTSAITVDGKADINLHNGNAISAIRNGSTVTVGGGNIQVAKNDKNEFYALKSDGGVVNVNMNADKNAAGIATTVIKGNVSAYGEKAKNAFDMDVTDSIVNIGLADKKSSWTGTAFAKDLGTSGFPFKGIVNLYLANGATWNNEAWGKTNAAFDGSHVTKLAGGASEAAAGNIFQKDSNNLTIDNYSGNTNIFYAHTGNGENASNYAAGDTIIKSAAAGSAVSLITDNTGISMDNDASVANVLNALAGKLTYSNFASGENNLNGSVKIADGLTSSSQTLKVDTIKFNKDTGKGYTKEETVNPGGGEKTTFTDAITGEKQGVFSAVQQEDLSYVFAEDASININQMTHKEKDPDWEGSFIISGAAVQNAAGVENLVINAADKTLKLKVALDKDTVPPDPNAGILNNRIPLRGIDNSIAGSTTSVTAGTLDIDIDNTYSRVLSNGNPMIGAGSAIGIYAKSVGEKAVVEVTGNTAIKAYGYNNVYGVNANGNAEIKLHGDLTMAKDGEEWALDNVIKGQNTTTLGESSWRNIAGINANGAGASVTVDGKTTIAAHGSGAIAADGATVNLGAADIEVKNNSDEDGYGFHALGAALGTVNVGGEGKTVTVKGNAGLFGKQGQKFAGDSKESVINLKLTTEDSAWTGVAYKHFDAEKDAGLSGSMNLTLANGASWNNEKYGYVYGDSEWEKYKFTGSEIADFVGGASDAKAGNIFQKDANRLTIDNYSGNTNIFYAHTGNGEAAENYAAGDTVIKHAAEGSVVSMITDNTGIAMDNKDSVNNVLNALAGKLTYSNFVNGEKNLTGYVKIADGLTASSAALKTGDIIFTTSGKGSYVEGKPADKIDFNSAITGGEDKDWKANGIQKEDGKYVMDKDITITMDGKAGIEAEKDFAINAKDHTLTITNRTKAGGMQYGAHIGAEGDYRIQAKKLSIEVDTTGGSAYSAIGIGLGDMGSSNKASLTIDGNVDIRAKGEGMAFGVYSQGEQKLTITGNVNMKSETGEGWGIDNPGTYPGALGHYHTNGLYAGFGAGSISVEGGVDLSVKGTGMQANGGATIVVNGGGNIKIAEDTAADQYALAAEAGTVSFHWKDLASRVMNDSDVQMIGNVGVLNKDSGASPNSKDMPATVQFTLDTKDSLWKGVAFNQYKEQGLDSGTIRMGLMNGATWINSAYGMVRDGFKGSRISDFHGGSKGQEGNIYQQDSRDITIDHYSGSANVIFTHTGDGSSADNYSVGNVHIVHADAGSQITAITDSSGIDTHDNDSIVKALNALAGKLYYDNYGKEDNLKGYVKISDGFTLSSQTMSVSAGSDTGSTKLPQEQMGEIDWSQRDNGQGSLKTGTVKPGVTPAPNPQPGTGTESPKIDEGDYETFVMKGARSAVTTSFHSWRDNMQDTYKGADLADEDGIFAKVLGGKTSSDVSGLKDSNSYWGAQVGYDKALANGWHTGVAFDYRDGDSDYLLGGKGDNKLYSFGVYGVKKMEDGSYFRVVAKAGRVENEYDVYTELRNKLHADYKANAYGLTAEYGKTFGSEMSYITPKVQLTWSRVGSKDYSGSANNGAIMNIYQDSYDSLVGRLGFEAGMKKAHGSLHAGLYLAHEFNGDIDTRYFAKDGGWKSTSFDGDDTWAELVLGGEYRLGRNSQLYADFARDLGGDFQRKWKLNAGIRLRF